MIKAVVCINHYTGELKQNKGNGNIKSYRRIILRKRFYRECYMLSKFKNEHDLSTTYFLIDLQKQYLNIFF